MIDPEVNEAFLQDSILIKVKIVNPVTNDQGEIYGFMDRDLLKDQGLEKSLDTVFGQLKEKMLTIPEDFFTDKPKELIIKNKK